jgi:gluconokinase
MATTPPRPPTNPRAASDEQRTTTEPTSQTTTERVPSPEHQAPALIVFGVTGAGKSLIGRRLAQQLGWTFHDADDYHSAENIDKLTRGIALTDDDRWPWLDRLRQVIVDAQATREPIVLAASALKRAYRRRLQGPGVRFVYLKAARELIEERLRKRSGHFMNPNLVNSQFDTLEEPREDEDVIIVDASAAPGEIVRQISAALKG